MQVWQNACSEVLKNNSRLVGGSKKMARISGVVSRFWGGARARRAPRARQRPAEHVASWAAALRDRFDANSLYKKEPIAHSQESHNHKHEPRPG